MFVSACFTLSMQCVDYSFKQCIELFHNLRFCSFLFKSVSVQQLQKVNFFFFFFFHHTNKDLQFSDNSITAVNFHGQRMTVKQNRGRLSSSHTEADTVPSALSHNGWSDSRGESQ